jgi:hypothetical protein
MYRAGNRRRRYCGLDNYTVEWHCNGLWEKILEETLKETPRDDGEFELDEPYSGAKRVFGLLKRGRKVFVKTAQKRNFYRVKSLKTGNLHRRLECL